MLLNTSSSAGLETPFPLNTNYSAANAAVAAMTLVHSVELSRYGVRVNCISPGARSRLVSKLPGGLTSRTRESSGPDEYDPWHPKHQATLVARLAMPDCPLTGQVLTVRGSTVSVSRNWSLGEHVSKEGDGWGVQELGRALEELPVRDPLDALLPAAAQYGITARADVTQLLHAMLDSDDRSASEWIRA